ncbi:iron-sulfur cluster biosynthesis family protein [Bacillus sp. PS06]|uniref:iron-sulfur cluster biosynthesis family protein n=1 Tax=Bacillus sp. PS06 TaxID=2764176 RepID=UPI00177C2999|nr:iron-sulfur cluster biosynthesis family protein [Bacillus sp. PS06]MBD8070347.1 iron-sulfur cluster biosynthesis family protein [Bacillus sp. PS06]
MEITFTKEAIERLQDKEINHQSLLKIKYETEGCGCVVSGVPTLWIVDQQEEDEVEFATNLCTVLLEKTKMVFFDEKLTIDYVQSANCYSLKSPNQIINPRMMLIEKREIADESKD